MSCTRVWRNMNSRIGSSARLSAVTVLILWAVSGSIASVLIALDRPGDMTKIVRNSAIPTSTWLGGSVVVPIARADEAEHSIVDAAEACDGEKNSRYQRDRADKQQDLDGVAGVEVQRRTVKFTQALDEGGSDCEGMRIGSVLRSPDSSVLVGRDVRAVADGSAALGGATGRVVTGGAAG